MFFRKALFISANIVSFYDQILNLTMELVGISSVSPDVDGENRCAEAISRSLQAGTELTPDYWPVSDGRRVVACLLRGEHFPNSGRTLILLAHHDTVGVAEFDSLGGTSGSLIAFHPSELRDQFAAIFRQRGEARPENPVWRDLSAYFTRNGRRYPSWLFGRGTLDMKSGVAVQVAVMRELWRRRKHLNGNILFLSCPDEENESAGIMAALPRLDSLSRSKKLSFLGVINADYTAPSAGETEKFPVYAGVIGKLMPSFYVLGVPTHAGEPFRGVDAGAIAVEIAARLHLNTDLCDSWPGSDLVSPVTAPPPVVLKISDLKEAYNVQTISGAWLYANYLTIGTTPGEALTRMTEVAREALKAVLRKYQESYAVYRGKVAAPKPVEGQVLTYSELCALANRESGPEKDGFGAPEKSAPEDTGDIRRKCLETVVRLARKSGLRPPAVVVYFSPPFYPPAIPESNKLVDAVYRVVQRRRQSDGEKEAELCLTAIYPYISDMSFLGGLRDASGAEKTLGNNVPGFGRLYALDFSLLRKLRMPVVNIGPWGKGAHGLYERVYTPFSFRTAPRLILEVVDDLLAPRP